MKVFCGSSNSELCEKIVKEMNLELGKLKIKKFSNGETYVQLLENVRGEDIFLIQTASEPINEHLIELLLMIDATKRASAKRITVVCPNYFYARQDRKAAPREPISARLVANMLMTAGTDRILTVDLHSDQTQGFFNIPFDNLPSKPLFLKKAKELEKNGLVVVAPDAGAAKRNTKVSIELDSELAIINKIRLKHNEAQAWNIIGAEIEGKDCMIFDDMVDTGGSLCLAAEMLKKKGAKQIYAFITHGILSGEAIKKIEKSELDKLFITDTIPLKEKSEKIEIISIARYLAEAIERIHKEKSVSELWKK
jgi:ribose-phosphate pyrophosphokinase